MGIERLFSTISRAFPAVTLKRNKVPCKYFCIDFNSIVHVVSSELQKEYEIAKGRGFAKTSQEFSKKVLEGVANRLINEILEFADGIEFLFIATDGVPSKAKMLEQRRRRYSDFILYNKRQEIFNRHKDNLRKARIYKDVREYSWEQDRSLSPEIWNRNMISPGTAFMEQLNEMMLSKEIRNRIFQKCPTLKHYVYSSSLENSEGEHKILRFLRSLPVGSSGPFLIFSPDSDMSVLSLIASSRNSLHDIKIVRHNQQKENYDIVDVDILRTEIEKYGNVEDISILLTVFGNDFLPKIPTFNISEDIQTLFVYSNVREELGGTMRLVKGNSIDLSALELIVRKLAGTEDRNACRNFLTKYYGRDFVNRIEMEVVGTPLERDIIGALNKWLETNRIPEVIRTNSITDRRHQQRLQEETGRNFPSPYEQEMYKFNNMLDDYNPLPMEEEIGSINVDKNVFPQTATMNKNALDSYYDNYFSPETDIQEICREYVKGIIWVFRLYFLDKMNDWVYKFERGPLAKDLANAIPLVSYRDTVIEEDRVRLHFNNIQQLLYVTPLMRVGMIIPERYKLRLRKVLHDFPKLDMTANDFGFEKLDCRAMIFLNRCINTVKFEMDDKTIETIFTDYQKNNFDFESEDPSVLFNQNFNIANRYGLAGDYISHADSFSDEKLRKQAKCIAKLKNKL
jgi:5'-3' exonuclease